MVRDRVIRTQFGGSDVRLEGTSRFLKTVPVRAFFAETA
jgi:hypothetical protein